MGRASLGCEWSFHLLGVGFVEEGIRFAGVVVRSVSSERIVRWDWFS